MRFTEIGQQLRAFRMESGLRAEEIAARLGVSRAALYRYEKGEVIKLDTIQRLAELLNISPLTLLGVGIEYYSRAIGYFERIRQIEESADQMLLTGSALCYFTTSDAFDNAVAQALEEAAELAGSDRAAQRVAAEQLQAIQIARKRAFATRKPAIICMIPASLVQAQLAAGIAAALPLSDRMRRICRQVAADEIARTADLMEAEPMGLQLGLILANEPASSFDIMRNRDRAAIAINPFRAESPLPPAAGVAMITGADEAITVHQRVAETRWREAVKGAAGAARLREMVAAARAA